MSRGDRREDIAEELTRLGWSVEQLALRRKNDPDKLAIAARLRKETTLTVKDIAQRLHLGTSKSAHSNLYRFTKAGVNRIQPGLTTTLPAF